MAAVGIPERSATSMALQASSGGGSSPVVSSSGDVALLGASLLVHLQGSNFEAGDTVRVVSVDTTSCSASTSDAEGVRREFFFFPFFFLW